LVNWNDGILLQKHEPDTHQFPDVTAEATHTPPGGRVGYQGTTGVSRPAAMVSAVVEDVLCAACVPSLAPVYEVPCSGA